MKTRKNINKKYSFFYMTRFGPGGKLLSAKHYLPTANLVNTIRNNTFIPSFSLPEGPSYLVLSPIAVMI